MHKQEFEALLKSRLKLREPILSCRLMSRKFNATNGRVQVKATFDGHPYRGFPWRQWVAAVMF